MPEVTKQKRKKRRSKNLRPILTTKLKELREMHRITDKELAKYLDIDLRYYKKIETGESVPMVYLALMLSEKFRLPLIDIFPGYHDWFIYHLRQKKYDFTVGILPSRGH